MDILTSQATATTSDVDVLIVLQMADGKGAGVDALNTALDGLLDDLWNAGDLSGAAESAVVLYPRGGVSVKRLVVVGLGETLSADALRRAAAVGAQKAVTLKAKRAALVLSDAVASLTAQDVVQAVAEGALMGTYRYNGQKTQDTTESPLKTLEIIGGDTDTNQAGIKRGRAYAEGAILARDLVNLPPNICNPAYMARRAIEVANASSMQVEILEEKQMQALRMGALLGVAQGSHDRPRFIVLEHNADQAETLDSIVLVGKGVTFDTGGYSLKTRDGMIGMKGDMGGGAAVIAAMQIIAALDVPYHVVGLVPTSDNNVSDKAYRPQEVLTASNGKTIEVISTDAEGRLLLADALVYAKRYAPAAVVDIATLTGSCVVALGHAAAGVFATDDRLRDRLQAAGDATSERVWPLPLYPEYDKAIQSQTADIKNSGGRMNGVGTSAAFLRHFVDYPAWAHVDMAGMVDDADGNPTIPIKGATGYGARLLAHFVENWEG